jgi:hypothetical protein
MLIPRNVAPALVVETLLGTPCDLSLERPARFSLVWFYRGLHCPVCSNYLRELDRLTPAFRERGVTTVAISSDTEERARQMSQKIGAVNLRIGYGLELPEARKWGLYISASRGASSIGIVEPPLFSEPGVFLFETGSVDLLHLSSIYSFRSAQLSGDGSGARLHHQYRLSGEGRVHRSRLNAGNGFEELASDC